MGASNAFCLLFLLLLPCLATSQNGTTVSVNQSLTAGDNSEPWLSPARDFAFGFRQLDNKDLYLPAIWYYMIPNKTIVWYASADKPAPRGSKIQLTADRGLVLDDPDGAELWKSDFGTGDAAVGFIYDTGNLLIVDTNSEKLWQSFDHPTDTLLPTQIMEKNGVVSSRRTETDFSRGRFQFRLLEDGNAVLNTISLPSSFTYDAYFWSNTLGVGKQVVFDESGYLYVLRGDNQRVNITPGEVDSAEENYYRATVNYDGVFILYSHPKNSTGNGFWSPKHTMPDNICVNIDIRSGSGSGTCGYNSICTLSAAKRPICECPKGFSLDPDDVYGSCKPDFMEGCEENGLRSGGELYYVEELKNTDWIHDYEVINFSSKEECASSCLNHSLCGAAVFRGDICRKKKLPLSYGKKDPADNAIAFIKIRKVKEGRKKKEEGRKKKEDIFIVVGSVLLGSSVVSHMNLHCFSYKELSDATHGFKEELGRGAFGIVYKGFMETGSDSIVAVKKLDRKFRDGEKEFKAEVNVIGQTHHKNLVRLVGFCDEGENRLLVYEFMSNGTLASFLFGDLKPNWNMRTQIAMGIARGLFYLHEECCTQIIHCDIKPQNILLDDSLTARISDFGLAKLLTLDQSHTRTKGYVAPEWFRNTPVTVKVDVYSFGVLLLKIISLRRSVDKDISTLEKAILTDWAYDCYQERKLDALVEIDLETMTDMNMLERFVMVAIWCIQEDPSLRPTMRKVTQMLEGVVEVPIPPCPYPFNITS
ncbi:hypothetical protein ACOSQ2_017646 [Xanthoceras sorbifolium]